MRGEFTCDGGNLRCSGSSLRWQFERHVQKLEAGCWTNGSLQSQQQRGIKLKPHDTPSPEPSEHQQFLPHSEMLNPATMHQIGTQSNSQSPAKGVPPRFGRASTIATDHPVSVHCLPEIVIDCQDEVGTSLPEHHRAPSLAFCQTTSSFDSSYMFMNSPQCIMLNESDRFLSIIGSANDLTCEDSNSSGNGNRIRPPMIRQGRSLDDSGKVLFMPEPGTTDFGGQPTLNPGHLPMSSGQPDNTPVWLKRSAGNVNQPMTLPLHQQSSQLAQCQVPSYHKQLLGHRRHLPQTPEHRNTTSLDLSHNFGSQNSVYSMAPGQYHQQQNHLLVPERSGTKFTSGGCVALTGWVNTSQNEHDRNINLGRASSMTRLNHNGTGNMERETPVKKGSRGSRVKSLSPRPQRTRQRHLLTRQSSQIQEDFYRDSEAMVNQIRASQPQKQPQDLQTEIWSNSRAEIGRKSSQNLSVEYLDRAERLFDV